MHQSRPLKPTPPTLVKGGRVVEFGAFDRPFARLNIEEADIYGIGGAGSRLVNRLRLKEWQHFAVFGPDFLLAFVALDAHYMASSFCYFVDRASGEKFEHHREGPSAAASIGADLIDDDSTFRMRGHRIHIQNRASAGWHAASVDIAARKGVPAIAAELEFLTAPGTMQPLEVVLPVGPNRPAWSRKFACAAQGQVRVGERTITLDPNRHLVIADFHKAFYPYQMQWTWATCAGFADDGRIVGINLTHNVVADDENHNENGLWVGNRLSRFGAARFRFDEADLLAPWHIATTDGRCRVNVDPIGKRSGHIDMGVLMSDYHQPYGIFNGEAVDDDGVTHPIRDFFGVTELHRARF
jgi:hypothetical protein